MGAPAKGRALRTTQSIVIMLITECGPPVLSPSSLFSQAPAHGEGELFFSTGTHWIFQLFQIRQNFSNKVAVLCALHKEKRKKKKKPSQGTFSQIIYAAPSDLVLLFGLLKLCLTLL